MTMTMPYDPLTRRELIATPVALYLLIGVLSAVTIDGLFAAFFGSGPLVFSDPVIFAVWLVAWPEQATTWLVYVTYLPALAIVAYALIRRGEGRREALVALLRRPFADNS